MDIDDHDMLSGDPERESTFVNGDEMEALEYVSDLLRICGTGLLYLHQFRLRESIRTFARLPQDQYETGWVYAHVARAYYEDVNYMAVRIRAEV
jgi:hypothetical protein